MSQNRYLKQEANNRNSLVAISKTNKQIIGSTKHFNEIDANKAESDEAWWLAAVGKANTSGNEPHSRKE